MQSSLEQAVQLEEGRMATVALRSKCRKLESESLFADVFEKYEEEIRQLQVSHFIQLFTHLIAVDCCYQYCSCLSHCCCYCCFHIQVLLLLLLLLWSQEIAI